ncbi:hypothetical protein [Nocardia transvalensis]|uniref:hypothetical protein n=1 Tax=Nocardia transvalensis TaxID=37333 RepID=UPI001895FD51|nr:hypothetical protein [Nocardia transvalensis]MBF6331722.1 hypothetical protein [Nocardia transvalensis]
MRGRVILSAAAIAAAVCTAGVVPAGAEPTGEWVVTHPESKPFDYRPGDVCAFGVHVEFPVSDLTRRVWHDPQGRPVHGTETGALVLRATNVDTGKTVERDVSGDGTLLYPTLDPADYVLSGRDWAAGIYATDQPAQARNHWYISRGFMSVRITSHDGQTSRELLALAGPYEDLCQTLGS